jgi:hypothetical protein
MAMLAPAAFIPRALKGEAQVLQRKVAWDLIAEQTQ